MSEQILINITPQETRVAVMQQGVVQELHIERASSHGMVGNVYQGRVCRVLPGMQSATCKNAARSSPISTNADCIPGNTRHTRP